MAKIPGPEAISGPVNLGPSGPMAQEDPSGLIAGLSDLSQGISQGANSLLGIERVQRERQAVSDVARARSAWLKGTIDLNNTLDADGNFHNHEQRAQTSTEALKQQAAAMIRDERTRQAFLADLEDQQLRFVDTVHDRVQSLQNDEDRTGLVGALNDSANLISEPTTNDDLRRTARADITGAIDMALQSGLILPSEAAQFREKFLTGADQQLAQNRLALDIKNDPVGTQTRLGMSSTLHPGDAAAAAAAASPKGIVALDPGVAEAVARQIGDQALPEDPALQRAYLSDPSVNQQYARAALEMLTERYDGDMAAALIASAPGGGTALAEAWQKSGRNDAILPTAVRSFYRKAVEGIAPVADHISLPVISAPDVDIARVDAAVLDRWEKVQGQFGKQLVLISGYRDPAHNEAVGGANRSQHMEHRAIDIDVSSMSKEDRIRLIETASAAGFTGIGVYANSLHLDTGPRRAWGPSYHSDSVPGWASDVIGRHVAGEIADVPVPVAGVAPEYQALSFDQRMQGYERAHAAAQQQGIEMRAGIEVATQNTAAAIMSSGTYTGYTPTAEDFVHAYGAADGIDRFKQYRAGVDVAEAAYGMRTMSNADILELVRGSRPTSTSDEAGVQAGRFEAISKAADEVLKQREEDPAAYTMSVFPNIAEAFNLAETDPVPGGAVVDEAARAQRLSEAMTLMYEAQDQLGIENKAILPKAMATEVAAIFNNKEATQAQRTGAIASTVFRTSDEDQQRVILDQLIKSGVTPGVRPAMDALARGDDGAAAFLFRAAMIDLKEVPLPDNIRSVDIDASINRLVLDDGQLGDIMYLLSDGTAENFQRAEDDLKLFKNAVHLRLADGTAMTADDAVRMTMKDMWGDVRAITGRGLGDQAAVKITLPVGEDPGPMRRGFDALLAQVGDALSASMTPGLTGASTNDSMAAILATSRDNYVTDATDTGYFANFGRGEYAYVDPRTGAYVPDENGDPLTFTKQEVIFAGQAAAAWRGWAQQGWSRSQLQFPTELPTDPASAAGIM